MSNGSILIIDDDRVVRLTLERSLEEAGYEVTTAADGASALQALGTAHFDVALLDYVLPDTNGIDLLARLRGAQPDLATIMITSHSTVETAVDSIKAGASDYIAKPFSPADILLRLDRVLETRRLHSELGILVNQQRERFGRKRIVGASPALEKVFSLVDRIRTNPDATILIQGESGTGKDLLARAIHYGGPRAQGPYMNITCTALPENLLESELFGHEKGAFTDAKTLKKGLVELADGGTLFLDEIGDMSLTLQARLLRFLEDKTFRRVGGQREIRVRARIMAATNRDLQERIRCGQFREDLFFRLNVIPMTLPPLRERAGDIPLLVEHFIDEFSAEFRKDVKGIAPDLLKYLEEYAWPGNVRELRNTIERAMILASGDVLRMEDILEHLPRSHGNKSRFKLPPEGVNLEDLERDFLVQALEASGGHQDRAAHLLGLNRDQVRYRMQKYGMHGGLRSPRPENGNH